MRIHPLWRGFWLAAAMAAGLVLLGGADSLGVFLLERRAVAFAGAMLAGAFLGGLPSLLRRSRSPGRFPWRRSLRGFLCGMGMTLALGMAGDGRILPALMTGSAGAYAFCGTALISGFLTVRIMGRARA